MQSLVLCIKGQSNLVAQAQEKYVCQKCCGLQYVCSLHAHTASEHVSQGHTLIVYPEQEHT